MIYGVAWGSEKLRQTQTSTGLMTIILAGLIAVGFVIGSLIWQCCKI